MGTALSIIVSLFISLVHPAHASVITHAQVQADETEVTPTDTPSVSPSISVSPTDMPSGSPTPTTSVSPTITPNVSPTISPVPSGDVDDQGDIDDHKEDSDHFKNNFGHIVSGLAHEKNEIKVDTDSNINN